MSFKVAVNNAGSICTIQRNIGGTTLTVGDASSFGTNFPLYISVHDTDDNPIVILVCTNIVGNALTISGVGDNTTDANVLVGYSVEVLTNAGYVNDLNSSVDNITGITGLLVGDGSTLTAATISSPLALSGTTLSCSVTTGPQGYQGYQGVGGASGSQGVQGYQGYQGNQGNQGNQGSGIAAGSNTQIQYNNSGAFAGTAAATYSTSGNLLTAQAQVATDIPLTVQGTTSQTGNLFQSFDNNGNLLSCLNASGFLGVATAPSYSVHALGSSRIQAIAIPAAPTVTVNTTGSTTFYYGIVAADASGVKTTYPNGATVTSVTNSAVSGSINNTITWSAIPGATTYYVCRAVGSNILSGSYLVHTWTSGPLSFTDTVASPSAITNPTSNLTGALTVDGGITTPASSIGGCALASGGLGCSGIRVTGGNTVLNASGAALPTTATSNFPYIPSCAGTPTGTPTAFTGAVPMIVDTTNSKIWFYIGGAWKGVTVS